MPTGGKREGAGRPKKDRTLQAVYETAEDYLEAVVKGLTLPDAVRVAAAKALIQYQKAKQRAPVKSPTPSQLHQKSIVSVEKSKIEEFEKKAAVIREKLKNQKGGNEK